MSWLPVANIHGVVAALRSISPKYVVHTVGSKLSKPVGDFAVPVLRTGLP